MDMKAPKHNFVSWNRGFTTFQRHLPIVLKPLVAGVVIVLFWRYVLVSNDIVFEKESENTLLFIVLPLVSFIYVIFASLAVTSVFNEYKTISRCVVKKDLDTFLLHRDEQLPLMMHMLVGAPSLILVILTSLFHYPDQLTGMFAIFMVVFMVVITWVIATELDDFAKSIWFKEKIPKEWFDIDIDKYFSKKK